MIGAHTDEEVDPEALARIHERGPTARGITEIFRRLPEEERSFNDLIDSGWGDDIVLGMRGNDIIEGSQGNDRLYGGFGDDRIAGGQGNDLIHGNQGKRSIEWW